MGDTSMPQMERNRQLTVRCNPGKKLSRFEKFNQTIQPISEIGVNREVLLWGKAQYSWPPCTYQFRSARFYTKNIILLFYKTSYLNEEVNCNKPSPLS